jgi:hypothetical protein
VDFLGCCLQLFLVCNYHEGDEEKNEEHEETAERLFERERLKENVLK